ncbi:MAG TPA: hypothetical protein VHW44_25610 [Pseudonocardiaceae bacterium]|jgi:hypothetical protein|nr:hypothetical protein [Pseudonocardiaceae bacterium]
MPLDNKIAVAISLFVFGLVVLFLLWPGRRQGERLLRRWGIADPGEQDIADGVRYLRRRRFWYPWLFLLIPGVIPTILGPILVGGLLAEVFAQRPARQARRSALLVERRVLDLVPWWAIILFALASLGAAVRLGLTSQWVLLTAVVVTAAAAWVVVLLAVRRPAIGRAEVDLALRTRSARVAVGLAIAAVASLGASPIGNLPGFLAAVLGVVALIAISQPDRHRAPAALRAG